MKWVTRQNWVNTETGEVLIGKQSKPTGNIRIIKKTYSTKSNGKKGIYYRDIWYYYRENESRQQSLF